MSAACTGGILLKCALRAPSTPAFRESLGELAKDCVPRAASVSAHAAIEVDETYLYLLSPQPAAIDAPAVSSALGRARGLPALKRAAIAAARLLPVFDVPGPSRGEDAPFHYVVETDVVPEHEADFNAWYDEEHMPGLAACPGSVYARRFRDPDGSPRYHACYELARVETFGSPPWLAVRHSAWSDRIRPHFRNTKRTMFRRLFEIAL